MDSGVPLFLDRFHEPGLVAPIARSFSSAKWYDRLIRLKCGVMKLLRIQDAELALVGFDQPESVLDIGCGPNLDLPNAERLNRRMKCYTGIDVSAPFAVAARLRHPEDHYYFAQASAMDLPFPDDEFEVCILSFVCHHVEGDLGLVLAEASRVSRSAVVIYDHVVSDGRWMSKVQLLYWRLFDGGTQYLKWGEWESLLRGYQVVSVLRTGALGRHVVKMVYRAANGNSVYAADH